MPNIKENRIAGFGNAKKDRLIKKSESVENTKGIDNHLQAAEHFSLAAKQHYEAAKYHEEGNHEKANQCALIAIGHSYIANDYQKQDAQHHAL